eukprot:6203407-Pleurochrysis_carterae.AAC.1
MSCPGASKLRQDWHERSERFKAELNAAAVLCASCTKRWVLLPVKTLGKRVIGPRTALQPRHAPLQSIV